MEMMAVGDVLSIKDNAIIVHGCNTFGAMGAGIALSIKNKYPGAYSSYTEFLNKNKGKNLLGMVDFYLHSDNLIIANALTQSDVRKGPNDTTRYVSYDAIDIAFKSVAKIAKETGLKVHYPCIGAGLANGNFNIISKIINENLKDVDHVCWSFNVIKF